MAHDLETGQWNVWRTLQVPSSIYHSCRREKAQSRSRQAYILSLRAFMDSQQQDSRLSPVDAGTSQRSKSCSE